jgi:hypothetical protein
MEYASGKLTIPQRPISPSATGAGSAAQGLGVACVGLQFLNPHGVRLCGHTPGCNT